MTTETTTMTAAQNMEKEGDDYCWADEAVQEAEAERAVEYTRVKAALEAFWGQAPKYFREYFSHLAPLVPQVLKQGWGSTIDEVVGLKRLVLRLTNPKHIQPRWSQKQLDLMWDLRATAKRLHRADVAFEDAWDAAFVRFERAWYLQGLEDE